MNVVAITQSVLPGSWYTQDTT